MAKLPTTLPQSDIDAVQSAAKKWRDAEKRARQSVYSLLQAIYEFGLKHNANTAALDAWLAEKDLQVDRSNANAWTAACKLAIAEHVNGTWKASYSQVHKYSYVLRLAEAEKKASADISQWFKEKSLSGRLEDAYAKFLPKDEKDEKLEQAEEKISKVWEEAAEVEDDLEIKIDIAKAGITEGRALLPIHVAADGTVTILGIVQPDLNIVNADIKRILQEPKSEGGGRIAGAWVRLEQLCKFATAIGRDERYLIIENTADSCMGKALHGGIKGTIILTCTQGTTNEKLPEETFVFDLKTQEAFMDMRRNFRNFNWEVVESKGEYRILITAPKGQTFGKRRDEIIKERQDKAKVAAKASGKTYKKPADYELPIGLVPAAKDVYAIPLKKAADVAGTEFAVVKKDVEWSDWAIPATKAFRDEMVQKVKVANKVHPYQKLRMFNKYVELYSADGKDDESLNSVPVSPPLKQAIQEWFAVSRDDFSRVMRGFNSTLGKIEAGISVGDRMIRIDGRKGSSTFQAFVPEIGIGSSYDPTSLYKKALV